MYRQGAMQASPLVNVPRTFLAHPHLPRPYAAYRTYRTYRTVRTSVLLYYNEGMVATVFLPTHYATRRFYEQIFKNIDKICLFSLK